MSISLQRYPVFDVATPLKDLLFFEVVDYNLQANRNMSYGDAHHDVAKYPHHVLVYITPADKEGKFYRFYYAAKRENQDQYNWEFQKADIGGVNFDAVKRTYIILRSEFNASTPAMGSPMPDIPEDLFIGDYVLARREQVRTPDTELDSMFVFEQRTYVKRCTIKNLLGSNTSTEERLYFAGELINGVPVEDLFNDPSNSFWSVQAGGFSRVGKQLSCNWYLITTQNEVSIYFIWPTPNSSDYLFYVIRTADTPPIEWNYGDPFGSAHPNHKLVYVSPVDQQGRCKFYYASDRINQDAYNWEFTSADIGGTKFNAVMRTYLIPRASFSETSPAMGSAMPNVPVDKFAGPYVLAERAQKRTGEQEFDSLYVIEQRTYIKRCTLTEIVGSKISKEETLYYKTEIVTNGFSASALFDNSSNSYWGSQGNGITRTGKQLSCEWYLIVEEQALEVYFIWPTPRQEDFLFYVVRNSTGDPTMTATYGSSYSETGPYSSHKLVYVSATDESGRSKFYYAAPRINEDDYNWQINQGNELIRTYVVLRENFSPAYSDVTNSDSKFGAYAFADETVIFEDEILNGLFIGVKKRFIRKETIDIKWNKDFEAYIEIKKEIVKENAIISPSVTPGQVIEVQDGNAYYKVKITQKLLRDFPYQKASVPDSLNINFPNKLESVELLRAYAWADSVGAPLAYDADHNYKYTIKVPRAGPYSAIVERHITADPSAIVSQYPINKIPVAQIDTVSEVWAWWWASSEGNMARAKASSMQLPATVHNSITVTVPQDTGPVSQIYRDTSIPATPGFAAFVNLEIAVMQHEVREMDMGLYEVSVVKVDVSNLYS
jgi:hypothetical protein